MILVQLVHPHTLVYTLRYVVFGPHLGKIVLTSRSHRFL